MKLKIVSLLPSATEIISILGLQENLVGVSHECDFPAGVNRLPKVTQSRIPHGISSSEIDGIVREQLVDDAALYSLNMPILEKLQPDLIVTQALCDVCAVSAEEVDAAACTLPGNPQVINLEPMTLDDVLDTIKSLAIFAGVEKYGEKILQNLTQRISAVRERSALIPESDKPTVGFLEWIDPLFNAGHWTPELIQYAGGKDSFGNLNQPSETISELELTRTDPEVLFVALCGFNFERTKVDLPLLKKIKDWNRLNCVKSGRIYYTDGNAYFSRPGPRLVDSLEIIAHCLHPKIHSLPGELPLALNFSELL